MFGENMRIFSFNITGSQGSHLTLVLLVADIDDHNDFILEDEDDFRTDGAG